MTFSLYAAIVPSYLQILNAVASLLAKGEAFCTERGIEPGELIHARLTEDMLPFAYQVKSAAVHSLGSIEGVRRGVFRPDMTPPPGTFAALKSHISETILTVEAIAPAEVDGFLGRDMRFSFGDRQIDYTAENFLLSFAQPNFYFHAATAYDILRSRGVQIGKRDFMGRTRIRS